MLIFAFFDEFDKLKKKLEERNSLLKERTDKLLRLEAIQSDLREENEVIQLFGVDVKFLRG